MTKNLVSELREAAPLYLYEAQQCQLLLLAANEIERLQRYIEALESVADSHGLQIAQTRCADEPLNSPQRE